MQRVADEAQIVKLQEFEPRLAASHSLGPQLADARYLVPALSSSEFREIIEYGLANPVDVEIVELVAREVS